MRGPKKNTRIFLTWFSLVAPSVFGVYNNYTTNTMVAGTVDPGYVSTSSNLLSRHVNNPSDKHSNI